MERSNNSPILWPKNLTASRDMSYESLDCLYQHLDMDSFGENIGLIVSCSRQSLFKNNDERGVYHKLDITALPDLASAKISITHEVLPGLESSAQIIPVNEKLKVACFDSGCIMPVKNFGLRKTFHTDVRGRLAHHSGQVTCLAASSDGTKLASGCTAGEITLYQVCQEEVKFTSRAANTGASFISAMTFVKPPPMMDRSNNRVSDSPSTANRDLNQDENLLIYTTNSGRVCLIDTRCKLGEEVHGRTVFSSEPRVSFTSILSIRNKPGHLLYLGGSRGEVLGYDLRKPGRHIYERQREAGDGAIRRMKEILVHDGASEKTFLAFSNSTQEIKILDLDNMKPHKGWSCDRLPEGRVLDLIQVGDRIITCGDKCSIGSWRWDTSFATAMSP